MDPEFYVRSNHMGIMRRRDTEIVLKMYGKDLNKELQPETILEIGCGLGIVTHDVVLRLFPTCTRIVGVDKFRTAVNCANMYYMKSRIIYLKVDILEDLEVEAFVSSHGKFSKVFSFYSLQCITNHRRALENIRRLMTDEGEFLLVFMARNPVYDMCEELAKKPEWAEYMTDYEDFIPSTHKSPDPVEEFSRLMDEAGLEKKSCRLFNQSYTFPTTDDVADFLRNISAFIDRIPEEKHLEFVDACLTTLVLTTHKPSADKGETHNLQYVLLIAHGEKSLLQKEKIIHLSMK